MEMASRAVRLCCLWLTPISDFLAIPSYFTLLDKNSLLYNLIFLLLSHHVEVEVTERCKNAGVEQGKYNNINSIEH